METTGSELSGWSPVPNGIRLSLLWSSLMFLYIYNDYFSMYRPGVVEGMAAGQMGPIGEATDTVLVIVALILAVPALMIYLSTALAPSISRWLNISMGSVYTVIEVLTFFGSALFYQMVVILEILLTSLIVWHAIRWRTKQGH